MQWGPFVVRDVFGIICENVLQDYASRLFKMYYDMSYVRLQKHKIMKN